jgi:hypothetical protein
MNYQKSARTTLVVGTLLLIAANPVWANVAQDAQESAEAVPHSIASGSDEMKAAAEDALAVEAEPSGLDIPMDGSSLEAWNQSMEKVKEVGGPKEYGQLQDAFDYLLMFDIGAKNDPATLASRLNGLTGNEILTRVAYRKGK